MKNKITHWLIALGSIALAITVTYFTAPHIHNWVWCGLLILFDVVCASIGLWSAFTEPGKPMKIFCIPLTLFFVGFFATYSSPATQLLPALKTPAAMGGYSFPSTNQWTFNEGTDYHTSSVISFDPGTNCDWEGHRYLYCLMQSFTNVIDPSGRIWQLMSVTNILATNWVAEHFSMIVWLSSYNAIWELRNDRGIPICTNYGRLIGNNPTNLTSSVTNTCLSSWSLVSESGSAKYYRLMLVNANGQPQAQPDQMVPCPQVLWWVVRVVVIGGIIWIGNKLYQCITNMFNTNSPLWTNLAQQAGD